MMAMMPMQKKRANPGRPMQPQPPATTPPSNGLGSPPPQAAKPAPVAPQVTAPPSTGLGRPPSPAEKASATPGSPTYAGYEDSTEALVNDMAQQDSLLMQQASTSGLQTANDRGMVNSSMAAGASQAATLDYIVPIASQDANQAFTKNMSGIQTQQDLALANFDRQTQQTLQKTQIKADARQAELDRELALAQQASEQGFETSQSALDREFQSSQLQSQQAFEASQLQAQQEFEASLDQSSQDFEQQMAEFEAEQLEQQREFEAQQAELDRQIQAALAEMDLAGTDQAAATAMLTDAWSDYNQMYAQILANPDLSAEEREAQINTQQEMLDDRITYTTELYGTSFDWPDNVWDTNPQTSTSTTYSQSGDWNSPSDPRPIPAP